VSIHEVNASGPRLFVEASPDLPLVRLQVAVASGAAADPEGRDGLCNFATELMGRGAAGRTRAELDAAFDALGTSLDVSTDHDSVTFDVTVLRARLDAALALVGDVILRPDFPPHEAEKLKREVKAQLDELRDDDAVLARRFFQRAFYGAHPYGRSALGTEATLDAIGLDEARAWHAENVRSANLLFGAAGDADRATAEAAFARHLHRVPDGPSRAVRPPDPPGRRGQRLTLVDKPERTQSQILIGQMAPKWGDDDFYPLQVATLAFGGTFTARLMNEVRSKRGLSYGASARLGQARGRKSLMMHVFPSLEQTVETLELVLGLYRDWAEHGISADELEFARGYLASSFAFNLATPEDRLDLRFSVELSGVASDYADTFTARIRAVTADDVARVMRAELRPDDLEICIVATADQLLPRLEKAGLLEGRTVEVVPYDAY
jgi:zinc protease